MAKEIMSLTELMYFGKIEECTDIKELEVIAQEGDKLCYGSIRLRAEARIKELQDESS